MQDEMGNKVQLICRQMEAKDLGFAELLRRMELMVTQERIDGERSLLDRIAKIELVISDLDALEEVSDSSNCSDRSGNGAVFAGLLRTP